MKRTFFLAACMAVTHFGSATAGSPALLDEAQRAIKPFIGTEMWLIVLPPSKAAALMRLYDVPVTQQTRLSVAQYRPDTSVRIRVLEFIRPPNIDVASVKIQFPDGKIRYIDAETLHVNAGISTFEMLSNQSLPELVKHDAQLFANRKKQEKKEGVVVGMTQEQVLGSMWGKPRYINTTTNAYGTHEQWVYRGHNYLYFENGRLTTIQN